MSRARRESRLIVLAAATIAALSSWLLPAADVSGQPRDESDSPRAAAPIDLTGYWVSLVSEDWRFRMSVAQKGDWDIVPLNATGQRTAENADLTGDPCMAYGAAGIMRVPGRLHVTWEDDSTLRVDTDAGIQTRRFHFAGSEAARGDPSRQGYSVAQWRTSMPPPDVGANVSPGGELHVSTSNMLPGFYFKHGVPYSEDALLSEYFARLSEPNGDEYLLVTSVVEDPRYLRDQFVRTLVFKLEADDSGWNPAQCSVP
jgi:hypothetical protein